MKTILAFILLLNYSLLAQINLGSEWEVEESGHFNETWFKSEKTNIFNSEYYNEKGLKITAINEVNMEGKHVVIQRVYSSDGEFCRIEGYLNENYSTIYGTCVYPLKNLSRNWIAKIIFENSDSLNLTGVWKCNDKGKYFIRQVGDSVSWYGEQDKEIKEFTNVAFGIIKDNNVILTWFDVPKGTILGHGTITLQIESKNKMHRVNATGDFGGSEWERIK